MGAVTRIILQDGIVENVQGEVYAVDSDGRQLALESGDMLISGQTLLLIDSSFIEVMQGGSLVVIEGESSMQDQRLAEEVLDADITSDDDINLESLAGIDEIQQAILAGEDPNVTDDTAPAAGPAAGDGGGTQTATPVIERTGAETLATAGFDTTSAEGALQAEYSADSYFQPSPIVGLLASQVSVTEGGTAVFTVVLDQITDQDISVDLTYTGTAADGSDYTGVARVIVPAGASSVDVDIATIDDGIYEGVESFTVTIDSVSGSGAIIDPLNSSADTDILDAQDAPAVSIAVAQSIEEGDETGSIIASVEEGDIAPFIVSIDQIADEPITVSFIYSGIAQDGSDFTGIGSVVIPAGEASVNLDILTLDDAIYEGIEQFTVTISDVSGADATISDATSAGAEIIDNEYPPVANDDGVNGDSVFLGTRAEDGSLSEWGTGTENEDGTLTYNTQGGHTVVVSATTDGIASGTITFVDTDFDDQHGVGIGVEGHDNQIDYDETISINFGGMVEGDSVIGVSGLGGHFVAGSRFDAKATWKAYDTEGNLVDEGFVQQDDDGTPMTNTIVVGEAFSRIELSVDSTGSSNFVIQYVKAVYVDDGEYVADEDTVLQVDGVLDNDTDPDNDPLTVIEVNGDATAIGSAIELTSGALVTMRADGTFDYDPNGQYNELAEGETTTDTFTYTISDGTGGVDSAAVTITIVGSNDASVVNNIQIARVSEEGLAGGILVPESGTTDSTVFIGTMDIEDVDSDASDIAITLTPPSGITSGGVALTWQGEGSDTLVGSIDGTPIITIEIVSNTQYQVTLLGPIDHPDASSEDVLSFDIGVHVSDGIDTTQASLTIRVEDDAPIASTTTQTMQLESQATNIMLILDVSGSMRGEQLSILKDSVNNLLGEYADLGHVAVNVVAFNGAAGSITGGWTDISTAATIVNALYAHGGTNYEDALSVAMDSFNAVSDPAVKIDGATNVSYFLSDGEPNSGYGIDDASQWESFLRDNNINSFAYGIEMDPNISSSNLDMIAYNGLEEDLDLADTDATFVSDVNDLPSILSDTVATPVDGNLMTGSIGADGAGSIESISIDGVTYINNNNEILTIDTNNGGELVVNMETGEYSYAPAVSTSEAFSEVIHYTLKDNDGDVAIGENGEPEVSMLTIEVMPAEFDASYNDNINDDGNMWTDDVLFGGAGDDVLDGSPAQTFMGFPVLGDDELHGGLGDDILRGRSGNDELYGDAGDDTLRGGKGHDILDGGAGDDELTGGAGDDTFVWTDSGSDQNDIVTDFNFEDRLLSAFSEDDKLDISDLLADYRNELDSGNDVELGDYLDISFSGGDNNEDHTIITVDTKGGDDEGNTVTITLENWSRDDFYNGLSDDADLADLLNNNNIDIDG